MQDVEATAEQIEAITAYTFTKKWLCAEATQMASPRIVACFNEGITFDKKFITVDNNRRLSILGDAVLAKALCARWFGASDNQGQGVFYSCPSSQLLTICRQSAVAESLDNSPEPSLGQRRTSSTWL
jgi:hypothetical protein